jgi:hypothetical protein
MRVRYAVSAMNERADLYRRVGKRLANLVRRPRGVPRNRGSAAESRLGAAESRLGAAEPRCGSEPVA